jgi:hypothetical protein
MAKTQLIRKSFNAGELSPELHYRDDLAAYVKGCKHLTNMTPTPYGAVTRRPPFEVLTKIDEVLYGVPIRYIPFKFSLTEVFHIVFTDGSGSESTDPTTADLIIFDEDGNQVYFDGSNTTAPLSALPLTLNSVAPSPVGALNSGFVAMVSTIYDPADLNEIHFINVNDYVYLTCGGKYPVQAINRFFDKDEGGNRWKIAEWEINGGPFLDPNINLQDKLTTSVPLWDSVAAYEVGESVFDEGPSKPYNQEYGNYFDRSYISGSLPNNVYHLRQSVNGHELSKGDKFFTKGIILSGGVGCTYYATGEQANTGEIQGEYESETEYNVNFFWSNILIQVAAGGNLPNVDSTNGQFWKIEDYGNFYSCQQAVTASSGIPISDTAYWDILDRYSSGVNIKSDSGIFLPTDVNRQVRMKVDNKDGTSGEYVANKTASSIVATSSVTLKTEGGSWSGTLQLQESKDIGVNWETIGEITSVDGTSNGSIDREISDPNSLVRVKLIDYTVAATGDKKKCIWTLSTEGTAYEVFKITGFIDANNVTAQPLTPIASPRSEGSWALGAFSDTSGYPFSLTIHDERLALGGCQLKPNTVYASKVNEWDNFFEGSLETSPYTFTIASDSFDTIRSLKSSRQLNVLTDNAEVTMGSRDDNAITSITNISVSSHTNYGSNEVQAIQLADMIWFVMGQGERVRASKYDFASDGQQSIEMSLFASHITESGIKEMSFRRHPFNSLFCLLNNGTGAVLTYEGMQEVRAWATVKTDGEILSAASNYSDTGDIVAGIVKRGDSYFLEKFGEITDDTVFLDNQTTWVDADFTAGQPITQDDDGNLVVVYNDQELIRDVDYTIEAQSFLATNPFIDGFGDAYFDLTPPFTLNEIADLTLFINGVECPSCGSTYSFFVGGNDQATLWIKSDYYSPTDVYLVKNKFNVLVIPNIVGGANSLPADVGVIIANSVFTTGNVCIGRRIETRVNPTDISEVAPSGMVKRLTALGLYLLDSGTCNVEINGKPSPFTDGLEWANGQRESGLFELTTGGDYEQGLDINITVDNHRHFTLTGLGYRLGISQG